MPKTITMKTLFFFYFECVDKNINEKEEAKIIIKITKATNKRYVQLKPQNNDEKVCFITLLYMLDKIK